MGKLRQKYRNGGPLYIVGLSVGVNTFESQRAVLYACEAFAWLTQIALFLVLGLLVTPHELMPLIRPILLVTAVLVLVARPVATFSCLLPFGYSARESVFASWVGLRGVVPIYLTIRLGMTHRRCVPASRSGTTARWTVYPAGINAA